MTSAQEEIQYFNTEYPCDLFANPNNPCEIFLQKTPEECSHICKSEEHADEVDTKSRDEAEAQKKKADDKVEVININLKNTKNTTIENEREYSNKLQQYYKVFPYVISDLSEEENALINEKFNGMTNICNETLFYVQKMDRILMTMLFIFLDQGHDFHVAFERGNTTWTGVVGDTVNMVYKAPSMELIKIIDAGVLDFLTQQEQIAVADDGVATTDDDEEDDINDKETTSKSDFDEEEDSNMVPNNNTEPEAAPEAADNGIFSLLIDIGDLYNRLCVKTHNVSSNLTKLDMKKAKEGDETILSKIDIEIVAEQARRTSEENTITILFPYKNEYRHFAINTSFSGYKGVFGVMFIDDYDGFRLEEINGHVLELLMESIKYKITRNKKSSIYKIKITGVNNYGITRRVGVTDVTILPFIGGSIYNHGMHKIWDFNKKRHVFIITLDSLKVNKIGKEGDFFNYRITPEYHYHPLFISDLKIPEREVDLNFIIQEEPYKLTNSNVLSEEKQNRGFIDRLYDDFRRRLLASPPPPGEAEGIALKVLRGTKYVIKNLPIQDLVLEYVFKNLIQRFYQEYEPYIDPLFFPFDLEKCRQLGIDGMLHTLKSQTTSLSHQKSILPPPTLQFDKAQAPIDNFIFKQIGFVNDTSVTPSDNYYYNAFTNYLDDQGNPGDPAEKISRVPYKFTVVSGSVDGSKQGGQITPDYHPPELDVYMVIFNPENSEIRGIVARITFIKKVLGNVLNTKNSAIIDLHYVYVDVNFLDDLPSHEQLLDVTNYPQIIDQLLTYVLKNTFIKDPNNYLSNFVLRIPDTQPVSGGVAGSDFKERSWYKFTIYDNGPSVSDINQLVARLTEGAKLLDALDEIHDDKIINDKIIELENREKNKNLLFFILGDDDIELKYSILRVGQHLYGNTPELQQYFYPDLYDFPMFNQNSSSSDREKMNRNLTFERVFIIRNKYIGDKSRSTDCLFMNKSPYLECMQLSNDTNTFYTAQMFGLSTLHSTGGRSPAIYMAPYITHNNNVPLLTNSYEKLLYVGMSSSVNVHKLNRKKEQKEGKGGINESAIIFEKRVRKSSSILSDSPTQASDVVVDVNYISKNMDSFKVEELKEYIKSLGVAPQKGKKDDFKKQLKELISKSIAPTTDTTSALTTAPTTDTTSALTTDTTSAQTTAPLAITRGQPSIAEVNKNNIDRAAKLRLSRMLPPRVPIASKGGAVTKILPLSVNVPEKTTSERHLIRTEPTYKKKIVIPNNVDEYENKIIQNEDEYYEEDEYGEEDENKIIPKNVNEYENKIIQNVDKYENKIIQNVDKEKSIEQIYTEAYKNNLLYALKNNLQIIVKIDEKYKEFILNADGKLELQNLKITTDTQFFVANGLLSIRHSLISYLNSNEDLVGILTMINNETTLDQAISIKNRFKMFFDEYNNLNNIDLYGIKYFFDNTDILFEDPPKTVIEGNQFGGTNRYYASLFYCWQKNNNFVLSYIKKYVIPPLKDKNLKKICENNIHIADNLYKFLTSVNVNHLIKLKSKGSLYYNQYEYISFFYICFCNLIYSFIGYADLFRYGEELEELEDISLLMKREEKVAYQSPVEDSTPDPADYPPPEEEKLTSKAARNAKNLYRSDSISGFLGKAEYKFSDYVNISFSRNIINLFDIITKYPRNDYNNGMIFLFYLFYPDILKQKLIEYKSSLGLRIERPVHFNSDILKKITEETTVQDITTDPIFYIKEYLNEYINLCNEIQYYRAFIIHILINTKENITPFSQEYIQNVTNQLYNNKFQRKYDELIESPKFKETIINALLNYIVPESQEEDDKLDKEFEETIAKLESEEIVGGKRKNKISKKIYKIKKNKRQTNKKQINKKQINKKSKKQRFIKKIQKTKRKRCKTI
jgi:hypothetical protein